MECEKNSGQIPQLSVEMENLKSRIWEDLTSTLVNLSGSLKDIECGTRIKIPMDSNQKLPVSWICELLQVCRRLRECVSMDATDDSEGLEEEPLDIEEEPKYD